MGTRGLIHIKDGKKTIVTIYRQYDCYEEGIGQEIFDILAQSTIVNGYNARMQAPNQFNGVGCLAAYLIGVLKEQKIGNVYIMPPNCKDVWEEYTYTISLDNIGNLNLKVVDVYNKNTLYDGNLRAYSTRLKKLKLKKA
jgi:hypothetical protein